MPTKTKRISATLTVNVELATAGQGGIKAWLNECANGGKTTFRPGDTYHFLVSVPSNATGLSVKVNHGTARVGGNPVPVPHEEDIEFNDSYEATLGDPADSGFTHEWDGESDCGDVTLGEDKMSLTTKNRGDGTLLVSYSTNAIPGQGTIPPNFADVLKEKPRTQIRLRISALVPDTDSKCP